jgi:hypothetical protein
VRARPGTEHDQGRVRTGSWMGPPRGKRAPRVGIITSAWFRRTATWTNMDHAGRKTGVRTSVTGFTSSVSKKAVALNVYTPGTPASRGRASVCAVTVLCVPNLALTVLCLALTALRVPCSLQRRGAFGRP